MILNGTPGENTSETPASTPANTEPRDMLAEMMERIDQAGERGERCEVYVSRLSAAGREPLAKLGPDEFDPFTFATRFGAGRYFLRLKVNGQFAGAATIPIGPAPFQPAAAVSTPPPANDARPAAGSLTVDHLFTALMQAQAQQTHMMGTILTALIGRDQGGLAAKDLIGLMRDRSPVGEIVEGIKAVRDMGGGSSGGGEGGGGFVEALGASLAQALAPSLARFLEPRSAARPVRRLSPQAPPAGPTPGPGPARPRPPLRVRPAAPRRGPESIGLAPAVAEPETLSLYPQPAVPPVIAALAAQIRPALAAGVSSAELAAIMGAFLDADPSHTAALSAIGDPVAALVTAYPALASQAAEINAAILLLIEGGAAPRAAQPRRERSRKPAPAVTPERAVETAVFPPPPPTGAQP